MKKFLYILLLPFILIACGDDDEPQNGIFEMVVTEAPQDTETSVKNTECGISTNGEAQTIVVTLLGDYDSFRVTGTIPDWIYTTSSTNVLKFKLAEYNGDEYDVRSAEITFTVYKGNQSVNGRIIIHQYALTERIPPSQVNMNFSNAAWTIFGVQVSEFRYFNATEQIPSDFPYTSTTYTGYGGIWLIGSPMGETLAYDASCPVEAKPNVRIAVDAATFDGVCPECHSHYDLFDHGLPLSGKAADLGYGLVKYTVTKTSNGDVRITR